jgi:hypothetical protein
LVASSLLFAICASVVNFLPGCVQRTITITSEPPGALVWLNDREIGRTPLDVDFVYYGTYDVRLAREGYEPVMTSGEAKAPWWETIGLDLLAELAPLELKSHVEWHYELEPLDDDLEALEQRARDLRSRIGPPPEPAGEDATSPADGDASP